MCGIAGQVNWNGIRDTNTIEKICQKLTHRGPDDNGVALFDVAALGHTRLSIIDLSRGARQPMASLDGRYHIVYNGEVYNFKDLKNDLEKDGFRFRTQSDTEVVLYSYLKWREKCLDLFNGMFAFAIWDNQDKELFLAKDRFGKKPLYYHIDSQRGITFASELTALVEDDTIRRTINPEALNCYLALGYILSPMTVYQDIFKLEAATCLSVSNGGKQVRKTRYWDYAALFGEKTKDNENAIAENILLLLEEAVKRRMIADVPIGAFLSGGIDSSSVVRAMKKYHVGDLHTFSMGFDNESYNELADAEKAATWIGTHHHNKICSIGEDRRLLDDAIDAYDEPFADNSLIPMLEVSKLASSYVKVVLSGDGADEMFAGYVTYKADKYYSFAKPIPEIIKKMIVRWAGRSQNESKIDKLSWRYKLKQFFYGTLYSPEKAHYLWRIIFHPEERIEILGKQYRDLVHDTDPFMTFAKYYDHVKGLDPLDRNLYVDAMTWLADDILVKVDRASMRNSIEARCPYLDVDLVGYVASIPPGIKMPGLKTKHILKMSLKDFLPDFILEKPKSGFNAPTGTWIGSEGVDEFKAFDRYVFQRKSASWCN